MKASDEICWQLLQQRPSWELQLCKCALACDIPSLLAVDVLALDPPFEIPDAKATPSIKGLVPADIFNLPDPLCAAPEAVDIRRPPLEREVQHWMLQTQLDQMQ